MLSVFTWGGPTSRYVASEIFKANHGAIFNIKSVMWKLEASTKKWFDFMQITESSCLVSSSLTTRNAQYKRIHIVWRF